MQKRKLWNFISIFAGVRAVSLLLNLLKQLPFDPLKPAYLSLILFALFLFIIAIFALHKEMELKKQIKIVEKDEMTTKIGYTSLAFTAQIIPFIILLFLLLEDFFPFLEDLGAENLLYLLLIFIFVLHIGAYVYYSKHPEKT